MAKIETLQVKNDIQNYLDDANNDGNADFVTNSINPFNDQLLAITPEEIESYLDNYLISNIHKALEDFAEVPGHFNRYPIPEDLTDTICDSSTDYSNLDGYLVGKLPRQFNVGGSDDCPYDDTVTGLNSLSPSITNFDSDNDDATWANYIWYAVSQTVLSVQLIHVAQHLLQH